MSGKAWHVTVYRVVKSWAWLKWFSMHVVKINTIDFCYILIFCEFSIDFFCNWPKLHCKKCLELVLVNKYTHSRTLLPITTATPIPPPQSSKYFCMGCLYKPGNILCTKKTLIYLYGNDMKVKAKVAQGWGPLMGKVIFHKNQCEEKS